MEKAVLEVLSAWSKGTFTVQRIVYNNDENICIAVETSVWVSLIIIHIY